MAIYKPLILYPDGKVRPLKEGDKISGADIESVWIPSNPPSGCYKIVNMYVNEEGNAVVKYDDTPTP